MNLEIEDCERFTEKIKMFQRTNLKYLHTNKEALNKTKEIRMEFDRDRFNCRD